MRRHADLIPPDAAYFAADSSIMTFTIVLPAKLISSVVFEKRVVLLGCPFYSGRTQVGLNRRRQLPRA